MAGGRAAGWQAQTRDATGRKSAHTSNAKVGIAGPSFSEIGAPNDLLEKATGARNGPQRLETAAFGDLPEMQTGARNGPQRLETAAFGDPS